MEKFQKSINEIKNKSLNILDIIQFLLVILMILSILLAAFNIIYNWIISLFLFGIAAAIFLSLKFVPFKQIKSKLKKDLDSSSEILSKTIEENQQKTKEKIESLKNEKIELNEAFSKRKIELEKEYERRVVQIEMRHFREDFKLDIPDTELFKKAPEINQSTTVSEYLDKLSGVLKISINILKVLYQHHIGNAKSDEWNLIKGEINEMDLLLIILRRAGKLSAKTSEFQNELLIQMFTIFPKFDLLGFNILIENISKYLMFIQQYQVYLTNQGIIHSHERSWENIIGLIYKIFPYSEDYAFFIWNLGDDCIKLDFNSPFNRSIARVILFKYFALNYPDSIEFCCKLIGEDEDATAILKHIIQEHPEENEIGRFLLEIMKDLNEILPQVKKDRLYLKFVEELKNGQFITNEMDLFRKFIEDRIKIDEFREISAIIFDQKKPINLSNAVKHYFAIKIHDAEFLRSLNMNPIIKPFLLTFFSNDKLADYLKPLINPHPTQFKLDMKYTGAQYTNSARIGILTENVESLDKLEKEIKSDLMGEIRKDELYQNTYDSLVKVLRFFEENIEGFDESEQLLRSYNDLFEYMKDPSPLHDYLKDIYTRLSSEERHDIDAEWNILTGNLASYPPKFQVLIHELKYDPGTIKVFGNIDQLEPFELMKELFANTNQSPERLLALLEGNPNEGGISLRDLNKKLIEFMSFFDLLECSRSIDSDNVLIGLQDKKVKKLLEKESSAKIIKTINSNITNLLDFSFFAAEQLGLNVKSKIYNFEGYAESVERALNDSNDFLRSWNQTLEDNLEAQLSVDKIHKIAGLLLRSILYIALVVYHEIIKVPSITEFPELKIDEYEKILQSCFRIAQQTEETPNTFRKMDEPDIRNMILLNLNATYPNSVGGETFSKGGKSDILLRKEDSIKFVAECKIWNGRESLLGAIDDQLMNYITWRDSKNAIMIFNRNIEQVHVLEEIDVVLTNHSCFEEKVSFITYGLNQPGILGFKFHHKDDEAVKFLLTIMVFHIPSVKLPKRRR